MKHTRSFGLNPNHIEQVRYLINASATTPLMPLVRYYLGFNEVISAGRIKHIRFHFNDLGGVGDFPTTYTFNGYPYTTLPVAAASTFVLTLAHQGGGFFCIDMPINNFSQLQTGHHIKKLDLRLDFSKSYFKYIDTGSVITAPFAFIFYCDMYGQIAD